MLVRPTSNFPSKSSISNSNVSSEYTRDRRGSFANTWLPCARRRGYEKFGFVDVYYYAEERFGFSPRKTRYLLQLGQNPEKLPQLKKALEEGKLGWTKASRVARVATSEDEAMWLDSALSLSVRELDRKIEGERDAAGVKVRAWLTEDQAAVFDHAVETCRRVAGEDLDIGRCLEFMAAELIATYAHLGQREEEHDEENDCSEQPALSDEESAAVEQHICPEGDELPWPIVQNYGKTWNEVLERDDYRCQYPDCGARAQLHVHHIRFRSRSGRNSRAESNSPLPWCTTPIEAESSLGPDSHHPIISVSGIPSAVLVLRILHPILASTLCAANPLARIAEPTIAL